ncbi:unnamed protein product [Ceutorhynchus assimilis]|uniref:Uncharacterized protein n=1 Tax=Ceutorhynchus assimilis TaxID=467358 RepID=A0A9N9Q9D3_9CUCU|nr:unnamed protein product [Ceutorhynchus assimilis]
MHNAGRKLKSVFEASGHNLESGSLWLKKKLNFRRGRTVIQETIAPCKAETSKMKMFKLSRNKKVMKKKIQLQFLRTLRKQTRTRSAAESTGLTEPNLPRSGGEGQNPEQDS